MYYDEHFDFHLCNVLLKVAYSLCLTPNKCLKPLVPEKSDRIRHALKLSSILSCVLFYYVWSLYRSSVDMWHTQRLIETIINTFGRINSICLVIILLYKPFVSYEQWDKLCEELMKLTQATYYFNNTKKRKRINPVLLISASQTVLIVFLIIYGATWTNLLSFRIYRLNFYRLFNYYLAATLTTFLAALFAVLTNRTEDLKRFLMVTTARQNYHMRNRNAHVYLIAFIDRELTADTFLNKTRALTGLQRNVFTSVNLIGDIFGWQIMFILTNITINFVESIYYIKMSFTEFHHSGVTAITSLAILINLVRNSVNND